LTRGQLYFSRHANLFGTARLALVEFEQSVALKMGLFRAALIETNCCGTNSAPKIAWKIGNIVE
jgi:hypothetical protein